MIDPPPLGAWGTKPPLPSEVFGSFCAVRGITAVFSDASVSKVLPWANSDNNL